MCIHVIIYAHTYTHTYTHTHTYIHTNADLVRASSAFTNARSRMNSCQSYAPGRIDMWHDVFIRNMSHQHHPFARVVPFGYVGRDSFPWDVTHSCANIYFTLFFSFSFLANSLFLSRSRRSDSFMWFRTKVCPLDALHIEILVTRYHRKTDMGWLRLVGSFKL